MASLDQQLCGDVALLGELRLLQTQIRCVEIGTAILPVGVQEQRVQAIVEIVVMRDVAPRAAAQIELPQVAGEPPRCSRQLCPKGGSCGGLIDQKGHQVGYRALLDHQLAVHVEFAKGEFGIKQETADRAFGQETELDRVTRTVAAMKMRAVSRDNAERPMADGGRQTTAKQSIHGGSSRALKALS